VCENNRLEMPVGLRGVCGLLSLKRTVAGTGFLAQASMPRLGETNRGSPKF